MLTKFSVRIKGIRTAPTTSLSVIVVLNRKPVFGITAAVPISASRRSEKTTTGHALFEERLPVPPHEDLSMYYARIGEKLPFWETF